MSRGAVLDVEKKPNATFATLPTVGGQRLAVGRHPDDSCQRPAIHNFADVSLAQTRTQACPMAAPQTCPFGGACHTCPTRVQAKLSVGQPGDEYEREADEIADKVMRMPEPCCSGRVNEDETGKIRLQPRSSSPADITVSPGVEAQIESLRSSGGLPLSESERGFFEPRFGRSFGGVRVHKGSAASGVAKAISARAFTVGQDVVFGEAWGRGSESSRELLAHELAHVTQQQGSIRRVCRAAEKEKRETIVKTALGLMEEHYLMGAAGQIPGFVGGVNARKVVLNPDTHAASVDVYYGPQKGTQTHVCGGRYSKVAGLPTGDAESTEDNKTPAKHKWARVSDGEVVEGEACEGKKHFDCGGFVTYCYNQACPSIKYPGPVSNLKSATFGWTDVPKGEVKAGDIAYRSGHVGLCVSDGKVVSALGKKWGVHAESTSTYTSFGSLACLGEESPPIKGTVQKKSEIVQSPGPAEGGRALREDLAGVGVEEACGPEIGAWLADQMNANKNHPVIKTMREVTWPRYMPLLGVEWTGVALKSFASLVRAGGPWDFKSQQGQAKTGEWRAVLGRKCPSAQCDKTVTVCGQCFNYDVPGNIHYGYVGRAGGLRSWLLHFAAGLVQPGQWTDDKRDAAAIDIGEELWETSGNLCSKLLSDRAKLNLDHTEGCAPCKS